MDKYLSVRSVSRAVSFSPLPYIYFSFTSLPRHLPILCWSPIPGPCGLIGLHGFECELIKEDFSTGETNQMHFRVNLPSWTVLYPVLRPGARAVSPSVRVRVRLWVGGSGWDGRVDRRAHDNANEEPSSSCDPEALFLDTQTAAAPPPKMHAALRSCSAL